MMRLTWLVERDGALDEPVEEQREADHGDERGDAAVVVQEDWADGERAFEVGEAALDQVLALVGGKQLVGGERVVVADQTVAAVEPLRLADRVLVALED